MPYGKPKLTTHGKLKQITKNVREPGEQDNPLGCSGAGCT